MRFSAPIPVDGIAGANTVGSHESHLAVETAHRLIDKREAGSLKDPA